MSVWAGLGLNFWCGFLITCLDKLKCELLVHSGVEKKGDGGFLGNSFYGRNYVALCGRSSRCNFCCLCDNEIQGEI